MTTGSGAAWAPLALTALGVAQVRAAESRREDRLFDDPYAEAFLAAAPRAFDDEERAARRDEERLGLAVAFASHVVVRTRFFDDHLLRACQAGCRQVVLLAAGLDTRAFRLDWPDGTRVFELDLPDVLDFKEAVLARAGAAPRCQRTVVAGDLRHGWASRLVQSGFARQEPAAWLAEGLVIYLSAEEAAGLLMAVAELSAAGSHLAFEHGGGGAGGLMARARTVPAMERFTSLWKGGLGDDVTRWLERHGWSARIHLARAVARSYGRACPDGAGGFVTAVRSIGGASSR